MWKVHGWLRSGVPLSYQIVPHGAVLNFVLKFERTYRVLANVNFGGINRNCKPAVKWRTDIDDEGETTNATPIQCSPLCEHGSW